MQKQYDNFAKLKLKDMTKAISDMTYRYINPETQAPTKVPPIHYEKILDQVAEKYMSDVTSRQFLSIMYNQLSGLKKEDEKYFNQALLCMDLGINPKDIRIDEDIALEYTYKFMEEKQEAEKKNYHLLSEDIIDYYNTAKEDRSLQSDVIKNTNLYDDIDFNRQRHDDYER